MNGHCSKCGKIWTPETRQGVCRWCGKLSTCQDQRTHALHIKSRSNGRNRQAPSNHNGYDQLPDPWALFYKVGGYFVKRIPYDYRQDWLHDAMLQMAKVKAKYELISKPLTESALIRVASYQLLRYWRSYYKITNGLDCGDCSIAQRHKCRDEHLYSKCRKYHQLISLDTTIENEATGDVSTLAELVADDKAIDLDSKLDARRTLKALPKRLKQIGYIRYVGFGLDEKQKQSLKRYKERISQKKLVLTVPF